MHDCMWLSNNWRSKNEDGAIKLFIIGETNRFPCCVTTTKHFISDVDIDFMSHCGIRGLKFRASTVYDSFKLRSADHTSKQEHIEIHKTVWGRFVQAFEVWKQILKVMLDHFFPKILYTTVLHDGRKHDINMYNVSFYVFKHHAIIYFLLDSNATTQKEKMRDRLLFYFPCIFSAPRKKEMPAC